MLTARPRGVARGAAPLTAVTDKPSAALIKGQVTAFTGNLSGQDKQDVEYTTLAAQLNSDIVVPDNQSFEQMQAWFANYSKVMSNLSRRSTGMGPFIPANYVMRPITCFPLSEADPKMRSMHAQSSWQVTDWLSRDSMSRLFSTMSKKNCCRSGT